MGAQAFDTRQLTSANSSIPLEKRSRLGKKGEGNALMLVGLSTCAPVLPSYVL
jgi:hypothetical protein